MPYRAILVQGDAVLAHNFHASAAVDWSWTNMPAGPAFLYGSWRHVTRLDLSQYTEARLVVAVMGTAGATGARLVLRYRTAFSIDPAQYSDAGTSEVGVGIDAANAATASNWVPLASGAQADVWVAVIGLGGNGAADPQIGSVVAMFR